MLFLSRAIVAKVSRPVTTPSRWRALWKTNASRSIAGKPLRCLTRRGHLHEEAACSFSSTAASSQRRQGLYAIAELMEPHDFIKSSHEAMATCNQLCAAFDVPPTPSTRTQAVETLYRLDEISRVVCNIIDAAELCRSTHADQAWRATADQAFTILSDYIAQLNANVNLYHALKNITTNQPDLFPQLTAEEQRFALLLQAEFERDGIHLPDATREQVRQLQNNIVQLEGDFQRNMVHWDREFGASRSDVESVIPRHVLQQILGPTQSKEENTTTTTLNGNSQILQTLLKYSPSPELRKQVYMEYNTAVPENLDVLRHLRIERNALSTTLGFESFAARVLADNKMAKETKVVQAFLNNMASHNASLYRNDMELVSRAKQQIEGSDVLEPWDVGYYSALLKSQLGYDPNEIASYLTLNRCLESIQILCRDLFGIAMQEVPIPDSDRWDGTVGTKANEPRVQRFAFTEESTGRSLGTMYLDLHPRPGKYGHAAHFTVRCGCIVNGMDSTSGEAVHQLPIVALVCNLSSGGEGNGILSHGEVETLYHEMGHALHSLLSRTSFQHVSGTRAAMDFVETPSHLLENYVWDPHFLKILAVHPRTGESVPDDLIQKLVQSRYQLRGIERQSQILYAKFDQELFGKPGADEQSFFSRDASTDILANYHKELNVPFASGTHWHSRFGHLITYGAGYYSYLYAQEFASDIWDKKLAGQSLNKTSGQELWKKVLIHGGAKDPQSMLYDLLA